MRLGPSSRAATTLSREDAQRRMLFGCVAVSVALHAAVLLGFPGLGPVERARQVKVLTAALASQPARPVAAAAMPKQSQRRFWKANPETAQPVLGDTEPRVLTPSSPITEAVTDAPEVASTPAPNVETTMAGEVDANLLERYRLALIDAARRYKRYPISALERGWQGRVEVRLVVGSSGEIRNALIRKSSNYQVLDDQALDMVKKGTGREPIPPALHGREFTLDIPVIFELQAG